MYLNTAQAPALRATHTHGRAHSFFDVMPISSMGTLSHLKAVERLIWGTQKPITKALLFLSCHTYLCGMKQAIINTQTRTFMHFNMHLYVPKHVL